MDRKLKIALSITTIIVILIAASFVFTPQLGVLSISRMYLETRGSGSSGEILQHGNWRVLASTDVYGSITQFLTLNDTVAKQYAQGNDYPSDVLIQGSVTIGIFQNQLPYWHIPFYKIEDITVYPKTYGVFDYGKAGQYIDPKIVSIWRSDLANKELIIPFSVGILKTSGSKIGSLTTDYPGAVKISTPEGDAWQFSLSYKSIAEARSPRVITFYNPQDANQKIKMTMQWTAGGLEYDWPYDWVVITDKDGGSILSNNVFNSYDLSTIETQLNYQLGSPYAYVCYWFGGSGVYTGHGETTSMWAQVSDGVAHPLSWWGDDNSPSPIIRIPPLPPLYIGQLMLYEGYAYDTPQTSMTNGYPCPYEFPGWYVPAPGSIEGTFGVPPNWQSHRLPITAPTINDAQNTLPIGKSVVNYLASATVTRSPINPDVTKIGVQKVNPNVWGMGAAGTVGNNAPGLGVALPASARHWIYTLDVSTELVDTVVVQENNIHVSITNFASDRTDVAAGESANIVVELKNNDNYPGGVAQGFSVPPEVAGSCSITGGGGVNFLANEPKTVNLQIKNTGNLAQNTPTTFTYTVTNQEGTITDHRTLQLNFLAGLSVPDTTLTVTCLEADTNIPINGLKATVNYGATGNNVQTASTLDGVADFNLAKYTGAITLTVEDPVLARANGPYDKQTAMFNVVAGPNPKTLYFSRGEGTPADWTWVVLIAAIAAVAAPVGIYAYRKKKHS
jgi:hypothetical protein